MGDILVLIKTFFGGFAFLQVDAQFDKKEHHRLKGRDRVASRALGCDMFVEDRQGGWGLAHGDEFLSPLYIKRRIKKVSHNCLKRKDDETRVSQETSDRKSARSPATQQRIRITLRTFSGLIWGGGGMMGNLALGQAFLGDGKHTD